MVSAEPDGIASLIKSSTEESEVTIGSTGLNPTPVTVVTYADIASCSTTFSASSSKRNQQDADLHQRPPFPHKKQCSNTIFDAGGALLEIRANTPTIRDIVQPTMLSRVGGPKNCKKSRKIVSKHDRLKEEAVVTPDENTENGAVATGKLTSPDSLNERLQSSSSMFLLSPPPHPSHAISTRPSLGGCGRTGTSTDYFNRFVSPNTASVASALSLLGRLPYSKDS